MTKLSILSRDWCLVIFSAFFVLIALAIAYQPVMFNFFCSDDFYIVGWLDSCKPNPMLLFQTVYEGTPYYRPLLNVLLFLEYLICGVNSVYFRIIALIYLLLTAFVLLLLFKELANSSNKSEEVKEKNYVAMNWSFFCATFFLLYPLHTEPINWFVCTTEMLTTFFIVSSFLLYIYWRKEKNLVFGLICFGLAICAFLTKEIAVILPPILFFYEFLLGPSGTDRGASLLKWLRLRLYSAFKLTAIYWFLLIIYLCLRKIMTGNFLGNWSNVVFHFSDNRTMYKAWLESLKMIVAPLSSAAFGSNSLLYYVWIVMMLGLTGLTISAVWEERKRLILPVFFIGWFFICLLPMSKLLWITPDLLDARYGYIASIPLCALLMYGLAFSYKLKVLKYLRYPIFLFVIGYSCFLLRANNLAWAEAGKLTNNMLSEFTRLHREIPDSENIYLINIPSKFHGVAIAGLKTLESMNDKPFLDSGHKNCNWLLNDDQTFPLGIMKNSIEKDKIHSRFCWLSNVDQKFHPAEFSQFIDSTSSKNAISKKARLSFELNGEPIEVDLLKDLGKAQKISERSPTFIWAQQNLPCWPVDMLVFKVKVEQNVVSKKGGKAQVIFTNDILPNNILPNTPEPSQLFFPFDSLQGEHYFLVPLRGKLIWSLGGHSQSIAVAFPKDSKIADIRAYAAGMSNFMPKMQIYTTSALPGSESRKIYFDLRQVDLNNVYRQLIINYDVRSIKSCAGVALEVIGAGEYFEQLNSLNSDCRSSIELVYMQPAGFVKLSRSNFSGEGYYKVRLRPVTKEHKQCGFCSDHFIVYIQH